MADTPIPAPSWLGGILTRMGIPRLGQFFLSDRVFPVALVDTSVQITALLVDGALGVPASAGELGVPAANTRLADTGAMAVGTYTFTVWCSAVDGTAQSVRVKRRNAADAADIWSQRFFMGAAGVSNVLALKFRTPMNANERLVVENVLIGGAGSVYQAAVFAVLG